MQLLKNRHLFSQKVAGSSAGAINEFKKELQIMYFETASNNKTTVILTAG
jgi:hypothetical protein